MKSKEQFEVDVYTQLLKDREAELVREGMSREAAEDKAFAEISQQIRQSKSKR